jgi:hypothetical protein
MFRRKFLMAAIVAGIAALAGPATSQAAFSVTMQSGGSGPFVVTDNLASPGNGGSGGYFDNDLVSTNPNQINISSSQVGNLNGFSFTIIATSNSPGSPATGGVVTSSVISLQNNGLTAQRIVFTIFSDGFTIPGAGPLAISTVITSLSGLTQADLGTGLTQSQIYSTGTGSTSASTDPDAYFQSGLTLVTGPVGFTSAGTYSNQLVLDLYLDPGDIVFMQVASNVIAPAPAGLILAATALPFVGLLRRRLRRPETTTAA